MLCIFVRVLQRNRTSRIYVGISKEIYYEGWTHMIKKAKKSHDLLSASWKPRKASGVVPVQTWRPESHWSQWCNQSESEGPRTRSADVRRQEQINVPTQALSPPSCSNLAVNRLHDAHLHWWGWVFYTQSTDSNANLSQKHLHRYTHN